MLSGDINKKFNTDIRKFSRNYESSFFLSEYGVGEIFWNCLLINKLLLLRLKYIIFQGGSADSNVIFSPKSYIPRSFSSNFTLSLFGENLNILEVSTYLHFNQFYRTKKLKYRRNVFKSKK